MNTQPNKAIVRQTVREIATDWAPISAAKPSLIQRVNVALADAETFLRASARKSYEFCDAGLPRAYKRTAPLNLAVRDSGPTGLAIALSWYALGTLLR